MVRKLQPFQTFLSLAPRNEWVGSERITTSLANLYPYPYTQCPYFFNILLQAISPSKRQPRMVTLVLTKGTVGGASKVGLQLGGFSSTGVFIERLLPGNEAPLKIGDQLLEINETKIGW
jgi:hypothetical protein